MAYLWKLPPLCSVEHNNSNNNNNDLPVEFNWWLRLLHGHSKFTHYSISVLCGKDAQQISILLCYSAAKVQLDSLKSSFGMFVVDKQTATLVQQ